MDHHGKPKAGILALTLELYDTTAPDLRENRERWLREKVLIELQKEVEVDFTSAISTKEGIEAEILRFEQAGVDALILIFLTYSPSQIVISALKRTRLPLFLWNIQELEAVDRDFKPILMSRNHGVHGTQDMANVLVRCGVPFGYATNHLDDPDPSREPVDFCYAAFAKRKIEKAKFGTIGNAFPGMGDFAVDLTQWTARFGCQWDILPLQEYIERSDQADSAAVAASVDEYRASYLVDPDITDTELDATARAECALRAMLEDRRLGGLTYLFTAFGDDSRTSTTPFVAASRLMAEGYGFGGEGDLISTMATRMFHFLAPPVSFTEIFTTDYKNNALFFSHMGEMNVAMARRDRKVALRARPKGVVPTRHRQLVLITNPEPGPATFAALVQGGTGWKLLVSRLEIEDYPPLPDFYVPHFKASVGDVRAFLTRYALEGGTHHNAVFFGDVRAKLRRLSGLIGAEFVDISFH